MVSPDHLDRFIAEHRLPDSFRDTATKCYEPLAAWLRPRLAHRTPLLLGINGAQGTGKSTLAAYLDLTLGESGHCNVAILSIDDFYLTKPERQKLSKTVHPLLATRGVPGTHDIPMLGDCLSKLRNLAPGEPCRLPRFDKAADDRAGVSSWPTVTGPVDLVILEGWCVGSVAEPDAGLEEPLNELEADRDADGCWRRYVNQRLRTDYAAVFADLDVLVFLQAPDFDAILRWRVEQERKLAAAAGSNTGGVMNPDQVAEFIQYFERITRNNLDVIRSSADIVLELDEYHGCVASHYRD
ncbi:MAG TPA: kinase [Woeseiaceae bacterium]|nr:kinase [Woeseiaceae bacterium]